MALTESYVAGPRTPAVRDVTLGSLLEQAANSAPERIALIAGVPDPTLRRQWTYSELHAEAQRTARALLTRFKPGERIAVWAQNLPNWLTSGSFTGAQATSILQNHISTVVGRYKGELWSWLERRPRAIFPPISRGSERSDWKFTSLRWTFVWP